MNIIQYKDYLIDYIKQSVKKANRSGVVVGISGGLDSAVVICLCKLAMPKNHLAIFMPCDNSYVDYACVNELVYKFFLKFKLINIIDIKKSFHDVISKKISKFTNNNAAYNIICRIRMTVLYSFANEMNYLVVNTSNLIEYQIGYFTKYGDGAGDIFPLIQLNKHQVYKLGKLFEIPKIILARQPSAGLKKNQTDEEDLKLSYEEMNNYFQNKEIKASSKKRIQEYIKNSIHKRETTIPNTME